jgi:hypothetical protein
MVIRQFYLRQVAVGTPKKLALVACMRKWLTILDAIGANEIQIERERGDSDTRTR